MKSLKSPVSNDRFGLQSDIPDRALPHALHTLLVQQTEALEALLQHTHYTFSEIRSSEYLTAQDKAQRLAALTEEGNQRLTELEHKSVEVEQQVSEFQDLVRQ